VAERWRGDAMFSSGSTKVLGVLFALGAVLAWAMAYMIYKADPTMAGMAGGIATLGAICAVFAAACLVEKGRAVTGRLTALIACVICVAVVIAGFSDRQLKSGEVQVRRVPFVWMIGAVAGGYYTIMGRFPQNWTFDEIVGRTAKKPKRSVKSKPRPRRRKPLRETDE